MAWARYRLYAQMVQADIRWIVEQTSDKSVSMILHAQQNCWAKLLCFITHLN